MYNRNLNILIQSTTQLREHTLCKVDSNIGFNLNFITDAQPDFQKLSNIDILLIDTDQIKEFSVPDLLQQARVIFLSASTNSKHFSEKLHLADEVWLIAEDTTLLLFRFEKLLTKIKLQKEYFINANYFNTLIENVPDLIWFKSLDGIHLKVNEAFCKAVGKSKDKIEGSNHYDIWDIPKEVYEKSDYVCLNTDDVVIETLKPQAFDEKVFAKNGLRQFITYKAPLFNENNNLVGTMGCAHDVTDFKNINTELSMILDSLPFAILVKDNNNCIVNANEKFMELFNPTNKALLGREYAYEKYLLPNSYSCVKDEQECEIVLFKDNQKLIFSLQTEPLYDFFQNPLGVLQIYRDITLERNFENQMRQLAYTDQLTGLYQRRYLYDLEKRICSEKVNLMYIDLDNFKYINDNYGHLAGDRTLCEFANILKTFFHDDVVIRIGGDEFIVIIHNGISKQLLEQKACQLITKTTEYFGQFEASKNLSVSVGIAGVSPEHTSFDILLRRADQALYQAKNLGKSSYVCAK